MGATMGNLSNCSISSQCADDFQDVEKRPLKLPRKLQKLKIKKASHHTHLSHNPIQQSDYFDFVVLMSFVSSAELPPSHERPKHECIYLVALTTLSYLVSSEDDDDEVEEKSPTPQHKKLTEEEIATLREKYASQVAQLHELGFEGIVSTSRLFSLLQQCNGDLEAIINWFELRQHNFDVDDDFVPQPDLFSPSLSMTHSFSLDGSRSSVFDTSSSEQFSQSLMPIRSTKQTQFVYKLLVDIRLDRYFEQLVQNGYDSSETLQCARLNDLLQLGVKLGHARRIMDAVHETCDGYDISEGFVCIV